MKCLPDFKPKFYVTYDNQAVMDGVGAQLQRIVSVFGVSKKAKVGYLHSGLKEFGLEPFLSKTILEREAEIDHWNQLFISDLVVFNKLPTDRLINPKRISIFRLRVLCFFSRFSRFRVVCQLAEPRLISDKYPECLLNTPDMLSPKVARIIAEAPQTEFTIVVHIRQGVLVLSQFKDRLLPLSSYEKILQHLVPFLERTNTKYKILIPRENGQGNRIPATDSKVTESIALDPKNKNLDFTKDGYVTLIHEEPSIEITPILSQAIWLPEESSYSDFCRMIQADLLIVSKSSFSFVAGLFNGESIKIYTPFWHTAPISWIDANQLETSSYSAKFECILGSKIK